MVERPTITVVGSVNLDLVATVASLPVAGETVTGAEFGRFPGGKGANQALAAARLGADVSLIACVGEDANADDALVLLKEGGVDLSACVQHHTAPTGVALISVASSGENQIVVAPGANRALRPDLVVSLPQADALIGQLEVPVDTLSHAVSLFGGFVALNLAPAMDVPVELIHRADLVIVNETESAFFGEPLQEAPGLVARTFGASGAALSRSGRVIAEAKPPVVDAVDATGAGDAFTAALTVALVEGQDAMSALGFACAAGASAATRAGAQPSLPTRQEVCQLLETR
jgi:ribokinase